MPEKHAWLPSHHPPHANGCLAPCRVRRLAAAVCAWACPGVLLASTWKHKSPQLMLWLFLLRCHPARPDEVRKRSVARFFFCAKRRDERSNDLSSIAVRLVLSVPTP